MAVSFSELLCLLSRDLVAVSSSELFSVQKGPCGGKFF